MALDVSGALPVPFFASPGETTSLRSLLDAAYGADQVRSIPGVWLYYDTAAQFQAWNWNFWDPNNPSVSRVLKNGQDIGGSISNEVYVPQSEFDSTSIVAGNAIGPSVYCTVQLGANPTDPVYQTLALTTVPRGFQAGIVHDGHVTPDEVVAMARRFATAYQGLANPNDCHHIAAAIAGAAGATFASDASTWSLNPAENVESGFWRIVHRGSDNPAANWATFLLPGDIVRMQWADGSGPHTFLVTEGINANGQIRAVDNRGSTISERLARYNGNPSTVTIYRLSPDQLYLTDGSAQSDTLRGTVWDDDLRAGAGHDVVSGGTGNDRLHGGPGVNYLDGGAGLDTAAYAAGSGQAVWRRSGSGTWNVFAPGRTDTLAGVEGLQFADRAVTLPGRGWSVVGTGRFNGDGTADVLLQGDGAVVEWSMQGGQVSAGAVLSNLPAGWFVAGTGDFNGDGSTDVVLQSGSTLVEWFLNASGAYAGGRVVSSALPAGWAVVGTGDVNGDRITDLFLQGGDTVVNWVLNASGAYQYGNVLATSLPAGWQVVGTGDLNGDGIADVVLQGGATVVDWLLNSSGGYQSGNVLTTNMPAGWRVTGTGDFDGDRTSDLMIQGGGHVVDWMMRGGQVAAGNVIASGLPAGWSTVGTGDLNGDGTSDILVQGGTYVVDWLMSNGRYASGNVLASNLPAG